VLARHKHTLNKLCTRTPGRWREEVDALKAHITSKQPLNFSQAERPDFLRWAQQNLSAEDQARMLRMDQTYRSTAQGLDLGIEFKPTTLKDVMELRRREEINKMPATY
jgi:hypothetical protein